MHNDLAGHIEATSLCDSHEHLRSEKEYVENGPDILQNLFDQYYTAADLVVAGATQQAVNLLLDSSNPDIRARFTGIREAWDAVQHTGYGEATRIIARELYGIEHISPDSLENAQAQHEALLLPGKRLQLLRDKANLDHVQIDDMTWSCLIDESGPEFFLYDISWVDFCSGTPDLALLEKETGVGVSDLGTLLRAMKLLFEQNAQVAVAVKSQHAYYRTLLWQERADLDAERALALYLRDPGNVDEVDRLCLGDWCWARGVELAIEYDLPFKIHTGYYAHHSHMRTSFIHSGNLCSLLSRYEQARFVLMHIAYPYSDELVALTKHYPNVYADLCWAWGIDPYAASDFVRRCIHAVPSNKIFVFGGDTFWPGAAVAYAYQARQWLTRTLQAEVDEGLLNENEAIALASRFMRENQYRCFNVEEKRSRIGALRQASS